MSKTIKDYKDSSGLELKQIACDTESSVSSVSFALSRPWRATAKYFLKVAVCVGMPLDEAEAQWLDAKRGHVEGTKKAELDRHELDIKSERSRIEAGQGMAT